MLLQEKCLREQSSRFSSYTKESSRISKLAFLSPSILVQWDPWSMNILSERFLRSIKNRYWNRTVWEALLYTTRIVYGSTIFLEEKLSTFKIMTNIEKNNMLLHSSFLITSEKKKYILNHFDLHFLLEGSMRIVYREWILAFIFFSSFFTDFQEQWTDQVAHKVCPSKKKHEKHKNGKICPSNFNK